MERNCVRHQHCPAMAYFTLKVSRVKPGLLPFKLAPETLDRAKNRAQCKEVGNAITSSDLKRGQRGEKDGADRMGASKWTETILITKLSNGGDTEDKQRVNIHRKEDLNCFSPRLAVTKAGLPTVSNPPVPCLNGIFDLLCISLWICTTNEQYRQKCSGRGRKS